MNVRPMGADFCEEQTEGQTERQRNIVDLIVYFRCFANELAIDEYSYCKGLELTYRALEITCRALEITYLALEITYRAFFV
jgi:hypothetical protein